MARLELATVYEAAFSGTPYADITNATLPKPGCIVSWAHPLKAY